MFKKILIPLDGSTVAEAVLPKAIELAGASGAALQLLRAVEVHTLPGVDPTEAQVKAMWEAEDYLKGVADRVRAGGVRDVDTAAWYGPPAPSIIEGARLAKADLIAMTTHGRSGIGRLILGSVAEAVLRGTTIPILLLRLPGAPVEMPAGQAAPWAGSAPREG